MRLLLKTTLPFFFVIFFFSLFSIPLTAVQAEATSAQPQASLAQYEEWVRSVDIEAVRRHVDFLSGLGSRATGYPGNEKAAQYIYSFFRNLSDRGLMENISYHYFSMVDCVDHGANIMVSGKPVKLDPLLPNMVCPSATSPEGLTGRLIRVDGSKLEDFDGKEVEGRIVIMGWEKGLIQGGWVYALKLGAKAVIFTPPIRSVNSLVGWDNRGYLPRVPVYFPRFYVDETGAETLLEHLGEEGRIISTQRWERLTGKNVMATIRGTEHPNEYIVLTSYYDSYSLAPSTAPGAQEACGVAALLELARYLAENPQKYSVMIVAFGGHHPDIDGSRNWTVEYFGRAGVPPKHGVKLALSLKFQLNLDLSTGTNAVFLSYNSPGSGMGSGATSKSPRYVSAGSYFSAVHEDIMSKKPYGKTYDAVLSPWAYWYGAPSMYHVALPWRDFMYDHGSMVTLDRGGWTFTTAYDSRPFFLTPFDTPEKVNFANLKDQLEYIHCVILKILNEDELDKWFSLFVSETMAYGYAGAAWSIDRYFLRLKGQVGVWNMMRNWYDPVPGALVCIEDMAYWSSTSYAWRVRFTLADEEGNFYFDQTQSDLKNRLSAWVISDEGTVLMAPDLGETQYAPEEVQMIIGTGVTEKTQTQDIGIVSVFNASTMVIFDIRLPTSLSLPVTELGAVLMPSVLTARFDDHSTLRNYGSWFSHDIFVLAVPPNIEVEATWKFYLDRYPWVVLINGSSEHPTGCGYLLKHGQQIILPITSLAYAENLYLLNKERFEVIKSFKMTSAESLHEFAHAEKLLEEAKDSLANHEYSKAYGQAIRAWSFSQASYIFTRQLIEDSVSVVPHFAALILPFAFMVERLLFGWSGIKRAISFLTIFALTMVSLYLIHPGFQLAGSPLMIVVSISTLMLTAPLLVIMFKQDLGFLREIRIKRLGIHEAEIGRLGEISQAFMTGVAHMRRRRLRTVLTFLSIAIMVSSVVSLTSVSSVHVGGVTKFLGYPSYQGVYIHRLKWGRGNFGISGDVVSVLQAAFGDQVTIAPRAWMYTSYRFRSDPEMTREGCGFRTTYNGTTILTPVLWGLTPEDEPLMGLLLTAGRWFMPDERFVVILNQGQAETLGIEDIPVKLSIEQINYTVIGIVSEEIWMLRDLDDEQITPIKFDTVEKPNPWDVHVDPEYCVIMSYEDVIALGGGCASVSMRFTNATMISEAANEIYDLFREFYVYSCVGDEITFHFKATVIKVYGFEYQMIPFAILCFTIFNVMLGNVHERKREIFTYSTVGLSPLHVVFMFLAESVAYAVGGGVVGFVFAYIQNTLLLQLLGPVMAINTSSLWVLICMGISMLITVLSTAYPALVASKLVTPSLERVWRVPTSPSRDVWEVPFPFYASNAEEARGVISYLREFFKPHILEDAQDFHYTDLQVSEGEREGQRFVCMTADMRLYPYEEGVAQKVNLSMTEAEIGRWAFSVTLNRTAGPVAVWMKLNRRFMDTLRKQMLLWGSMPLVERERYTKTFTEEG